jgi:choline dehydrogenase-like flavoprotein
LADLTADVVIVGAGLAGAVVARRLAEAGVDVLCLEQGGWMPPEAFAADQTEAELRGQGRLSPLPAVRAHAWDYPIDDGGADIRPMLFNAVGGSTILYGGQWMRFLPGDFRVRSEDAVADDWPLSYGELEPYYARAEKEFFVAGEGGDPAYPPIAGYPQPALPLTEAARRVFGAHERLGWHIWPGANAIAAVPSGALGACQHLGVCGTGCPVRAKASVDLTHWPAAVAYGARLLPECRAVEICVDRMGRAAGVVFVDAANVSRKVAATKVVLAAGAIGTPRLLLASATGAFPDGLANGSGLVGRRLMLHPFTRVVGLFDEDIGNARAPWGQTAYSLEFASSRPERGFLRGAKWNLGPSGGAVSALAFPQADAGHDPLRRVKDWVGHAAIWGITCDDLPEDDNRVELDGGATDSSGLPGVRIRYRLSENSRAALAFNVARATESLQAAGAARTLSVPQLRDFGWHPLGTCRMGDDPATSVTDSFGGCHDVPGLSIVDASLMVTGSSVNPAATVAALALRAADSMLARR